jgi:hypothetical protein
VDAAKIRKVLVDKLDARRKRATSHTFYFVPDPDDPDVQMSFVWFSHGSKDISDGLLRQMAEELRLTLRQLKELLACSLSGRDALAIIKANASRALGPE